MRRTDLRATIALLLSLAAGCTAESTVPVLPQQNGLWTASASPAAILRFDPTQLVDTGEREAATALTTSSARLTTLLGVAFDDQGTLWLASEGDSAVFGFAPGALASGGSQAATTVIESVHGSLTGPTSLAFDAQGRLWVMDAGTGTLNRYDQAQLAAGGPQAPVKTLRMPGNPMAIAFDAAGALWVSDHHFHLIEKFTAAQLDTAGSIPPVLELRDSLISLVNPAGLAFDADGTLWVANSTGQTVVAFSPAQLAVGGNPLPQVVLTSNAGSLLDPLGLAFDDGGNLWVVGAHGTLTEFSRASLDVSGAPVAMARLLISGHQLFWSLAFWPKPRGLPLH